MRKPKYKRWPYGREWDPPKPKFDDFLEMMNTMAKDMGKLTDEFRQLQRMRKLGGEGTYLRALAQAPSLRAAFAWWTVEARTVSPAHQPDQEAPGPLQLHEQEQPQ